MAPDTESAVFEIRDFSARGGEEDLTMTKFWMATVAAILFGLTTTGCPDGDDDYDADADMDADSDAGSDADADTETDTSEDDGTTDETANCPNVAGEWDLTYRNGETGSESHETLTLTQDGCLIIGMDDWCEWSGTISESGYISVFVDCYSESGDRTVTGSFTQPPPHMGGDYWVSATPPWNGTWWADPR